MPNNALLTPAPRAAHAIASYELAVAHGHLTHRDWSALALHLALEASHATGKVGADLEARAEDAMHRSREARQIAFSAQRCIGCAGRVVTRCCLTTGAVQHVGPGFVLTCTAATPTLSASDALRRYDTAIANAETIGASVWRTIAMDLRDAADAIERVGGSVERQRKLRGRADDCAARGGKAARTGDES